MTEATHKKQTDALHALGQVQELCAQAVKGVASGYATAFALSDAAQKLSRATSLAAEFQTARLMEQDQEQAEEAGDAA